MECCLATGELIRLTGGARGKALRCTSGSVWLTKDDGQDYMIRAGRSFELPAGEIALIEALDPASILILESHTASEMSADGKAACWGEILHVSTPTLQTGVRQ